MLRYSDKGELVSCYQDTHTKPGACIHVYLPSTTWSHHHHHHHHHRSSFRAGTINGTYAPLLTNIAQPLGTKRPLLAMTFASLQFKRLRQKQKTASLSIIIKQDLLNVLSNSSIGTVERGVTLSIPFFIYLFCFLLTYTCTTPVLPSKSESVLGGVSPCLVTLRPPSTYSITSFTWLRDTLSSIPNVALGRLTSDSSFLDLNRLSLSLVQSEMAAKQQKVLAMECLDFAQHTHTDIHSNLELIDQELFDSFLDRELLVGKYKKMVTKLHKTRPRFENT